MSTDRTSKIEALFHAALEHEPAMRHAFLTEACAGDAELCAEVESLLEAHGDVPEFLDKPAWAVLTDPGSSRESPLEPEEGLPFDRLGEFRLIKKIGEGGMGVVYLAVQESLGREVALKVIRPERAGSMEAEARFLREADAVSELRHPHIVTVYGSGEEKGVRYFAMELLSGRRLDEIMRDDGAIETQKILRWIRDVADALDCAHRAGILHRDVKPSNIVITPEGRAMLMDFGVARNLNLSTLTLTGEFRGTPNYASPEQVKARRQEIDGRTDVYSLGVTLYEAITGTVPFKGETTEQVFHKILEEEPVPPRRLNPSVSRDLETVVLTAMEKEPKRRYPAMSGFVLDLEHLLRSEMIMAKPPGLPTKLLKRVKRHPVVSSAVAVAIATGLCFVLYVALISYPQILKEREAALKAKGEAELEADKAQAINRFLLGMLYAPQPGEEGKDIKVAEVLDRAAAQVENDFAGQPGIEAAVRDTLGNTYIALGLYDKAEPHLAESLELRRELFGEEHPETIGAMNGMGTVLRRQSRYEESEAFYRKALEISQSVHGERAECTLVSLHNLGLVLFDQGKVDEAEPLQRKVFELRREVNGEEDPDTLMSMHNLASTLWKQGRLDEAEELQRKVLEIRIRVLGVEHPSTMGTMNNLAIVYKNQGRLDEAEKLIRRVLKVEKRILGEDHPSTLSTAYNLANVRWKLGDVEEAETLHRTVYEIRRKILPEDHRDVLNSMNYVAIVCMDAGKPDDAASLLDEAAAIATHSLGDQHPYTIMTLSNLFCALYEAERYDEAEPLIRRLVEINRRNRGEGHPETLMSQSHLATVLGRLGREADAGSLFNDVISRARNALDPGNAVLAELLMNYGEFLLRLGRYGDAEPLLLESHGIYRALDEDLGKTSGLLAQLYEAKDEPEKAAEYR
jgi:tetratricopeptide (TPR) repeat protein